MQRVLGRFYSDWQVATKGIFCFLTLDRKPRLRSQSYIGPTIVGPDMEQNGGQLLHVLLPIELSAVTRKHRICNAVATVHGCLGSVDTEILVDSGSSA